MNDIVAFLNARLDEDEERASYAQTVIAGGWDGWEMIAHQLPADCDTVPNAARLDQHLQHNADPARVLREVKAKRCVLERHRPRNPDWMALARALHDKYGGDSPFRPEPPSCVGCGTCGSGGRRGDTFVSRPRTPDFTKCPELRDMATVYADHPDYDPAWAV